MAGSMHYLSFYSWLNRSQSLNFERRSGWPELGDKYHDSFMKAGDDCGSATHDCQPLGCNCKMSKSFIYVSFLDAGRIDDKPLKLSDSLPLSNLILFVGRGVDDVNDDRGGVGDTATAVVLQEVDLLGAVGSDSVRGLDAEIIAARDDAVLVRLECDDLGECDVIDERGGGAAAPLGGIVVAELRDREGEGEEEAGDVGHRDEAR